MLKRGSFPSPEELRQVFPSLDNFRYRDRWWIINLGGNQLRLMAFIDFKDQRVYIKHIVTHAEYDKLVDRYRQEKLKS